MTAYSCFPLVFSAASCILPPAVKCQMLMTEYLSRIVFPELYVISQIGTRLELILQSDTLISPQSLIILFFLSLSTLLPSLACGFRDESCLHADRGGVQPGPLGEWHPVLAAVHGRGHHLRSGCERAARLPRQPQDDPLRGGRASGDHTYRVCRPGPWPLHPPDCQVHHIFWKTF